MRTDDDGGEIAASGRQGWNEAIHREVATVCSTQRYQPFRRILLVSYLARRYDSAARSDDACMYSLIHSRSSTK